MIEHYNAFISYKHAPEDNKVAEAVHKGLERFHIPRKIRKKTGIKKISRIFRDKDELPITSDLSDSIAGALSDSDYLIVICSTNTKESAWVPREIEYFLKNHSKKQIFTVLVNGEPYDVIPDILKYEESVVKDEDGNERTVQIPTEPLSCDYRMSPGKAKKTELPRLVCGIIGCSYDELMNRRRQYRMKQFSAVMGLVLLIMAAFSGYMYYSRNMIHKSYLESLRNQSRYLANESGNLLEKEQRITALQLALEALPSSDEDDRPVTAEAVKALTDATLAYESSNGNNINAAWNYQMPGTVSEFKLSDDGKKLAIRDEGSVIGLWDTQDHNRVLYIDDNDLPILGMAFLDNDIFALWDRKTISAYDTTSGEKKWDYTLDDNLFETGKDLALGSGCLYMSTYDKVILKLDIGSGKMLQGIAIPEKEGYEDFSIVEGKLSPNGKKLAFRGLVGWGSYVYGTLDLETDNMELSELVEGMVKDIEWINDDTFVTASTSVDMDGSMSYGSAQILSTDHSTISCISVSDLSVKWDADFVCNGVTIESGFKKLGKDAVAYYSGNVVSVYDIATGTLKYSNNVNDSILDVSDADNDGNPVYITANGGYATPALSVDEDAVYYNKYFADELRGVIVHNGVYVRQRYGHEVIYYGVHVYDEQWTKLCDDASLTGSVREYCLDEKCLAVLSTDDDGVKTDVFTFGEKDGHFSVKLDGDRAYAYKLLGVYADRVYLGYEDSGAYDLITIDISSRKESKDSQFKTYATGDDSIALKDGKIVYVYKTEDVKPYLAVYDIDTNERKEIEIPDEVGFIKHAPVYYKDEGAVCIQGDGEFVFDIASGKCSKTETPEEWSEGSCYSQNSSNGLHAISDGRSILVADVNGKVINTVRCLGLEPLGITFENGDLVVLYGDGGLFRYDTKTGSLIKKIDASVYFGYHDGADFDVDAGNGIMYISMDRLVDVIDLTSGVEIAHITECYGHLPGRDIFITRAKESGKDYMIGYYKRYSVKELIDKAHDILKGAQLPEDVRSRYGIM